MPSFALLLASALLGLIRCKGDSFSGLDSNIGNLNHEMEDAADQGKRQTAHAIPPNGRAPRSRSDHLLDATSTRNTQSVPKDEIKLDGDLSDWLPQDSLMLLPSVTVEGFELFGRSTSDDIFVAISSSDIRIGPGSTIWLNTDQNVETGFPGDWGDKVGAEYNVNIHLDGKPYLYQGSAGEIFVIGPLEYAFDDEHKNLELKVPKSSLGNVESSIDLVLDINNEVFLPKSLKGHYTIPIGTSLGSFQDGIVLDGDISDWNGHDSLMFLPRLKVDTFELYGKTTPDAILLAIASSEKIIGPGSTIWLNTDQNTLTGWGVNVGAEYNVNIYTDGKPYLYQGNAGDQFVSGPLEHAFNTEKKYLELKIPISLLGSISSSIHLSLDINDETFLPTALGSHYTLPLVTKSSASSSEIRIGIVYSQTSANTRFSEKYDSQLLMAAQYQAMMAGIPYDLLTAETDLTDISNILKYKALVFPNVDRVKLSTYHQIKDTLLQAVYMHEIGLVVAGNLTTNDENGQPLAGNSYQLMNDLLNIDFHEVVQAESGIEFYADNITHPTMADYMEHERILSYSSKSHFSVYKGYNQQPQVLVKQMVDGVLHGDSGFEIEADTMRARDSGVYRQDGDGSVLATVTGGRNVHFSSHRLFGDSNLVWKSLQWVLFGKGKPAIGIKLTRKRNLFVARTDMDVAMFPADDTSIKLPLLKHLEQWKKDFSFVGSYYIDIGTNKTAGQYTDWDKNRPVYMDYIALGNEIGSHSFTHPYNVSELSPEQLEFEFNQSCQMIKSELALDFCGSALPGNPESASVAEELNAYLPYVTGSYSTFKGAFGFMKPGHKMLYFSPNMLMDYTMIETFWWDADKSMNSWLQQYDGLNRHASQPIIHWPWHDYAVDENEVDYDMKMFSTMLLKAHGSNAEFTTAKDAHERILAFHGAELQHKTTPEGKYLVKVTGSNCGKLALRVENGFAIRSVKDWYAYNNEMIFLPRAGGSFEIDLLGEVTNNTMRIIDLPMRADLISVEASQGALKFAFEGEGEILVAIPTNYVPLYNGVLTTKGESSSSLDGHVLKLNFDSNSVHKVAVTYNFLGSQAARQSASKKGSKSPMKWISVSCAFAIAGCFFLFKYVNRQKAEEQQAREWFTPGAGAPKYKSDFGTSSVRTGDLSTSMPATVVTRVRRAGDETISFGDDISLSSRSTYADTSDNLDFGWMLDGRSNPKVSPPSEVLPEHDDEDIENIDFKENESISGDSARSSKIDLIEEQVLHLRRALADTQHGEKRLTQRIEKMKVKSGKSYAAAAEHISNLQRETKMPTIV